MKGSMTVEAVFVVSILLLIILWIMKEAIFLYQQTVETALSNWVDISEAADTFRKICFMKNMLP